ncbi:hypothetical protein SBRY_90133 [Actinacidiphila bryophytorum]|uniref:Transposase n=1 Tax=Actinacidiphila bryophytorum TaxID=1436133 RepID=A0A9W4MKG7_9ACTN|nr:hypothetical protein SBRY_90133 [Actinacidiphila bryophytorum]
MAQALLGYHSEARRLRYARKHLCGMSRLTVQRSDLAGWAGYGYCAVRSRFFWGLRLYLVCTPTGMPVMWAPANPQSPGVVREHVQACVARWDRESSCALGRGSATSATCTIRSAAPRRAGCTPPAAPRPSPSTPRARRPARVRSTR